MGVLNIAIPMAKQRALAKAILAVLADTEFIVGCSSAVARTGQRLFHPPTADISATFDARVRQLLASATTYAPVVLGTRSPTATQLSSLTAEADGPPLSVGEAEGTATPGPTGTLTSTPTILLTPTVMPTLTFVPTATIVPSPTPTFDDD